MQFHKFKNYYLLIVLAVFLLISVCLHFVWRLSQVDAGICPTMGRVLSEDELRKRMLKNFVSIHVKFVDKYYRNLRSGSWRVGISPSFTSIDIKRLVRESFGNGKSFEDNFSIKIVAPSEVVMQTDESLDNDFLKKPFSLVFFTDEKSGLAKFMSTKSIRKIENVSEFKRKHKIGLFNRYLGFGENFYVIQSLIMQISCCDNRFYKRTLEEYMKNKREAYKGTLEAFDRGIAAHSRAIAISNCGDVMTGRSENSLNLDFVEWI